MASATERQKRYAAIRGTWTRNLTFPLLGEDLFQGDPGQPPTLVSMRPPHIPGLLNWEYRAHPDNIPVSEDPFIAQVTSLAPSGYSHPTSLLSWNQELLSTTLALQAPVLPEEWIVPRPYSRAISLRQYEVGLVNTTLLGQDTFYDAPGQSRPHITQPHFPRPPLHEQGWQWKQPLSLLGEDIFFGAPGQSINYQERWIVPKGYKRIEPALEWFWETLNTPQEIIGDIVLPDGKQQDDPSPLIKARHPSPFQGTPLTTVLLGSDIIYGGPGQVPNYQEHWIVPRGYKRIETALESLVETVNTPQEISTAVPPESRGYHDIPFKFDPRAFVIGTFEVSAPIGVDEFPPGLVDVPNPWLFLGGGAGMSVASMSGTDIPDTIYHDPGQVPNYEERWIVPAGYKRIESSLAHQWDLVNTTLVGQDLFFGAFGQPPNYEERWIVPKGYKRTEEALAWTVSLVTMTLVGEDRFYSAAGQVVTFGQSQPLIIRPFPVTMDLPNNLDKTLISQLPDGKYIQFANPLRYLRIHPQGWQFPTSLNLIGQDIFYGDPGQVITRDQSQPLFPKILLVPFDYLNNQLITDILPGGLNRDISQFSRIRTFLITPNFGNNQGPIFFISVTVTVILTIQAQSSTLNLAIQSTETGLQVQKTTLSVKDNI